MAKKRATSSKKDVKGKVALESQDDQAYITGQHSEEERQKQVRSSTQRREGEARTQPGKEEEDGTGQKED